MTYKLKGKAYWAKILGAPKKAYNPGEKEWSIDLQLDKAGVKEATSIGLGPKIRKGKDHSPFIPFKRRELKKATGEPNKPIEVVGVDGDPWPQDRLIGNESVVEVEFSTYVPKFQGRELDPKPNILKVQVLEHVPYEPPKDDDGNQQANNEEEPWA